MCVPQICNINPRYIILLSLFSVMAGLLSSLYIYLFTYFHDDVLKKKTSWVFQTISNPFNLFNAFAFKNIVWVTYRKIWRQTIISRQKGIIICACINFFLNDAIKMLLFGILWLIFSNHILYFSMAGYSFLL